MPRIALATLVVLSACQAARHLDDSDAGQADAGACAPSVAEAPLRRLTVEEYATTTGALLGDSASLPTLPPDEETQGYDTLNQGQAVSPLFAEALLERAFSLAERVDVRTVAGCPAAEAGEACLSRFLTGFGRSAYRRPLSGDEVQALTALYTAQRLEDDEPTALRTVLAAMLCAPQVLYRFERRDGDGEVALLDGWSVATRLAFFFWAQAPDQPLLDAAADGTLASREGVERQARRLLADSRARGAVERFHLQWLRIAHLGATHKAPDRFPGYEAQKPSMLEEARRLADRAVLEGDGHFERLLTARSTAIDASLAALYGFPDPGPGWQQVSTVGTARVGALTLAAVLAQSAKSDQSSPVLRGKLVRERFLCQSLPSPPGDVVTTLPPPSQGTTRERYAAHLASPSCSGCHRLMDPLGFGLERFDAVGGYRATENGVSVDERGEVLGSDDLDGAFAGAAELSDRLARSSQVKQCYAQQWFRFGFGRGETGDDACSLAQAQVAFEASGWNVRELLVAWAVSDAFRYARQVVP